MTSHQEEKPGKEQEVVCPMCGQRFICSHSAFCWCASRKIPAALSDYLAGRYETCLCSTCLDRLIEQFSVSGS
ncbi:MAG: cysteine-rich CWC family protein [Chlorobiaceae bacterium]|nr:cysteine-rich CWC family protein [Chlorobiaceae bacterium]